MKAHLYKMTCLTNMHVGNGDVNYSIIDNEVEKDPVLGEAVIPASGVKGALRSYASEMKFEKLNEVFGGEDIPGKYKFLSANLLARPVRVTKGESIYVLATCKEIIKAYNDLCHGLSMQNKLHIAESNVTSDAKAEQIEGITVKKVDNTNLDKMLNNEKWAVLSGLKDISLPVTARNNLDEKGISKNLWYEEYVPHHSVFYMVIITPGEENLLDRIINDSVIQFGADASVGCGLVKVEKI